MFVCNVAKLLSVALTGNATRTFSAFTLALTRLAFEWSYRDWENSDGFKYMNGYSQGICASEVIINTSAYAGGPVLATAIGLYASPNVSMR